MTIIRYQVFPSVRLSFFSINSLISSGFPLASFHLAEPKLVTGTILKNWKPLFRLPLIAKRCAGANVELKPQYLLFCGLIFFMCAFIQKYRKIFFHLHVFTCLVLILESTCFISTTWKRKQTMQQQPHAPCMWMAEFKTKTKSSHIQIEHAFCCSI